MTVTLTPPPILLTVPEAADRVPIRLDLLRKLIHRRPDLAELFSKIGPLRTIPESRLAELRKVLGRSPTSS
jgi:hypothetical protein